MRIPGVTEDESGRPVQCRILFRLTVQAPCMTSSFGKCAYVCMYEHVPWVTWLFEWAIGYGQAYLTF